MIWYSFLEGMKGLKKARLSGFLTVATVGISLFFVGLFYVASQNLMTVIQGIKARVRLEAFLGDGQSRQEIELLSERLTHMAGIDSVRFISKDEALEIFRETFEAEHMEIFEENPLPASFQIFVEMAYLQGDSVEVLANRVKRLSGINDVVFRGKILRALNRYLRIANLVLVSLGVLLGVLSFVLVANNIKLTIIAKQRIIEIMQLVGATTAFIKGPFLVQGALEGLFGGIFATILIAAFIRGLSVLVGIDMLMPEHGYVVLYALGALYGLFGSLVALRGRF